MFFLSLETSTVAFRTVLDELLCFFFCPEFDILPIFFQESFVFAFSFAFRRKFAPKIPAKFLRNWPFSPQICLFKSREISLFFPANYYKPCLIGQKISVSCGPVSRFLCHSHTKCERHGGS